MKKNFLFLLAAILIALSGCAPKGQSLIPHDTASERWQAFVSHSSGAGSYDELSGSLRFGPKDDTRRVTYTLWSGLPEQHDSGQMNSERIIRIEIGAGIGGSVGKIRIADGGMTLILPKEGRIYAGSSSDDNLRRLLGLSLPFSVQDLNDFLAGRLFSALDEPQPERYETQEDGSFVYACRTQGGPAEIELDARALPVRWKKLSGWEMDITYDENGLPAKISGSFESLSGEQRMVLLVKERRPASSMQASGLGLDIPAGFTVYSLD